MVILKQDLYINIDSESSNKDDDMPQVEKKVINLKSNIPADEDFGL